MGASVGIVAILGIFAATYPVGHGVALAVVGCRLHLRVVHIHDGDAAFLDEQDSFLGAFVHGHSERVCECGKVDSRCVSGAVRAVRVMVWHDHVLRGD